MKKFAVMVILSICSCTAIAEKVWEITGNQIESASIFNDSVGSTYYNVLEIELKNPISIGCAVSDNDKVIRYWLNDPVSSTMNAWLGALLAAQAQNSIVDIRTDNTVCSNVYGRKFLGVRIHSQ